MRRPSHMSRTSSFIPATAPNAWRAARSAAACDSPPRAFCAASMSRWNCSSRSSSRSTRLRWSTDRRRRRMRRRIVRPATVPGQRRRRSAASSLPRRELFPAGPGQLVELRLPVGLGRPPLRLDPSFLFEAMERGIERALGNLQHVAGDLLDALRDRPAVHRSRGECAENEQVQRALQQIGLAGQRASCSGRQDNRFTGSGLPGR